ncbi:unnamed protein product [Rhizophagus irregularis]|nr:unnamed protein product [Rhizophagus irregularis]
MNHQIIQILKSSFINNVEALVVKREVKNKRRDSYNSYNKHDYYHDDYYKQNDYYNDNYYKKNDYYKKKSY